eukprot:553893_1
MAQFFVNKNQWNFKLTENKKNGTISAKWTIDAGHKKKKHNVELIRHSMHSSSGPRLSQVVLNGNMIYETIDHQSQFELNIGDDKIDILIHTQSSSNPKYYLYINGNEYNNIINATPRVKNIKWECTSCRHKNYTHSKHCRLCRRKKRKSFVFSNNPLPPPPPSIIPQNHHDIPPPPPLPPVSIEEKYNQLLQRQKNYESIISEQKMEILQLKQKLNNKEGIRTTKKQCTGASQSDKERNALLTFMVEIQEKILLFEKSIHGIKDTLHQIDREKKKGLKLIDRVFSNLHTKITQRKNEMINKLETMTKIKENILNTQQHEMKEKLNKSNEIRGNLRRILDDNAVTKQCVVSKRKELDTLKETNHGISKVSSHLEFDLESDYEYLLHSIASFGNICTAKSIKKVVTKETAEMDGWDGGIIGDHLVCVSEENSVKCMEKECYSYRSCFGLNVVTSHTHHWQLRVTQMNDNFCAWNMVIGVMKVRGNNGKQAKLCHKNNVFTSEYWGYGFVGNLNVLSSVCGLKRERNYGYKLKTNDTIDVYLDLNEFTLSYKINHIACGIAYKNIENVSYCLAVSLCGTPNEIQIIQYNHEEYKHV